MYIYIYTSTFTKLKHKLVQKNTQFCCVKIWTSINPSLYIGKEGFGTGTKVKYVKHI